MESNLNRARTLSLGTTNSEIISSPESRSIPFRAGKSSNSNTNHVRFGSDPRTPNGKPVYDPTVRSASALGSPNPFGSFVHKHHHLEPLNEDDLLGSPTSDYDHPRTSMRDLQEQMNNLKGKINSLQQKSREDRMRRRSLQALKAPSPFTDAAVSTSSPYVEHMTSEGDSSGHSTGFLDKSSDAIKEFDPADSDKPRHQTSENDRKQKFLQDESQEDKAVFDQQKDSRSPAVITPTDQDLAPPILQPATSYRSESEEPEVIIPSSPTYETDFLNPNPPSIRKSSSPAHEDRPDAFDYETYVLNSTMGSYSRIGFRSRSNSISSVGSASTQRPTYKGDASHPETHPSTLLRSSHYRTNSSDSTSTTATFSTAITGRNDSRAESRASSRLQQQRQQPPTGASYYLSPRLLSRPSLPNLRQGMHQKLFISESQQKRDSFSPFPLPNKPASNFSTPLNSALPPHEARTQILAIILRSASSPLPITIPQPTEHPSPDDEIIRCWASEDESLVGAVLDGLVKVVGRVIRGEDEGGAGRSVLESIGAVLQR